MTDKEQQEQEEQLSEKAGKPNNQTGWTAEDFERYGKYLKHQAEERKKAEEAKQAEKDTEIKPFDFSFPPDSFPPEIQSLIDELRAKQKMQIELEGDRVRKQYGITDDRDISMVLKAEKEQKQCENCVGLPCKKARNQCYKPKITTQLIRGLNYLEIQQVLCKYERVRREQMAIQKKFGLSQIPNEYLGKTFEDYNVDANNEYAVKVAKKLVELPDKGAYFYGNVGTGKTFLAAILAQEIIKAGRQVIFATVPTISMQIRSTFKDNAKINESDILEKLYTVKTLILDDVGMEKPTRFVCSTLCNIFNERYNARLQTIMTSNYQLKELENIFNYPSDSREKTLDGTRIYDRCKQMCFPIELKGGSRR